MYLGIDKIVFFFSELNDALVSLAFVRFVIISSKKEKEKKRTRTLTFWRLTGTGCIHFISISQVPQDLDSSFERLIKNSVVFPSSLCHYLSVVNTSPPTVKMSTSLLGVCVFFFRFRHRWTWWNRLDKLSRVIAYHRRKFFMVRLCN
jgi:hypothetical protein